MVIRKNINLLILLICLHQFISIKVSSPGNHLIKKKKHSVINHLLDAMEHYKSGAGGTVKAGKLLIVEIRTSQYMRMKKEAQNIAKTIKSKLPGKTLNGSGNVNYVFCLTLGHFDFKYTYSLTILKNKKCRIKFSCRGSDLWDFEHGQSQNVKQYLHNLFQEDIPNFILGSGKKFTISYDFNYTFDV